ncbi:MAG: hypothetical protein JO257_23750 [Deltaproteobacteria bacterium]|nr:hypothetical protein [Deltaproteobacteria bacterium]
MKIALAFIGVVLIALLVAIRVPRSASYLEDVPGIGWLVDLFGAHDPGPIEFELTFDHTPSRPELEHARELVAARMSRGTVVVRGNSLFVSGDDVFRLTLHRPPLRVFEVVYESPELEALRRAMLRDDQAKALRLSVALDRIGYHVESPDDALYVNDAWAQKHGCTGHHIEGTGTACFLNTRQRFDAYVRGDADLFVDPHPLALPPGRNFYATDAGPIYELAAQPLLVPLTSLQRSGAQGMIPLGAAPAPDTELVVEVSAGTLIPGEVHGSQLAIPYDPEYELALLGLRLR